MGTDASSVRLQVKDEKGIGPIRFKNVPLVAYHHTGKRCNIHHSIGRMEAC